MIKPTDPQVLVNILTQALIHNGIEVETANSFVLTIKEAAARRLEEQLKNVMIKDGFVPVQKAWKNVVEWALNECKVADCKITEEQAENL